MKSNKVLPLSLAGSVVFAAWATHCRKQLHIELSQYQESSRLTYAVSSTATFTHYNPFSFADFDQYT